MNHHPFSNDGEDATSLHTRRAWVTGAALGVAIPWPSALAGSPGAAASPALAPTTLEQLIPSTRFAQVVLHPAPPWPAFNPSITVDGDGYAMIVRTANHQLVDGTYRFLDDRGAPTHARIARTRNYLVRLQADFVVRDTREIHDRSGREVHPTGVYGFENCRLVHWRDGWWATATVSDSHPTGAPTVMLMRLHDTGGEMHAVEAVELSSTRAAPGDTNWAPFVADGALRLVQSWQPQRMLEWNGEALRAVAESPRTDQHSAWHGSSQGAQVEGGWLFVVHEIHPGGAGDQCLHRFVWLADDGTARWSPLFTFTGTPVEFAAGLAVRGDDVVVVSFGVNDALAALAVVPLAGVLASLG